MDEIVNLAQFMHLAVRQETWINKNEFSPEWKDLLDIEKDFYILVATTAQQFYDKSAAE